MREIKFRAWYKQIEYMQHNVHYEYDWEEVICSYEGDNAKYVLMQYTGLKDKNDKEIYEGDCLGDMYEKTYIKYCDKCKQYELFMTYTNECLACSGDILWSELAEEDGKILVLGNIYENPELLGS